MSLLRIPVFVLFAAVAVAAERPITPPVYGPAAASQYDAAIASDGDGWLSVWVDKRAQTQEVRGTRIARDGTVLDPTGIPIFSGETTQPLVTWTGTSYLVLWSSLQLDGVTAVRIDRDGRVLDQPRILLAGAMPASVVSNGTHVVAGYMTKQHQIGALVLNPDASVVRDLRFTDRDIVHRDPAIAWNGSHFAAVWTAFGEHATLEAIRFNAAGKIDAAPRPLPDDSFAFSPAIASDGDAFVVIARESFFDGRYSARHLSAELATIAAPVLLPEPIRTHASILWLGAHYAVIGDYGYTITSVRLDRDAQALDAGGITLENLPITGSAPAPAVATNGSDVLVAWHGAFTFSSEIAIDTGIDVYGTFVSPATLQRETRALLSLSAPKQSLPFVVSGGTNLLAVWSEGSGLYARRLALDGSPLDATPLRLHELPARATATFNGSNYIVAWADNTPTSVVTRSIPREGTLRAEGGGQFYGFVPPFAMASNATTTLLVASKRVLQLAADGGLIVAPPITLTDELVGDVAIAAGENGTFLVTWGEMEYIDPFFDTAQPVRVRGARITESYLNLDPGGFTIADTPAREGDPAVAWNGREWLVVWSTGVLRGRRVTQAGFPLDDQAGVFIADAADRPEIAWDGSRYVVAWYGANSTFDPHPIHIAWLPQLGAPLMSERIVGEVETFLFTPVSLAPVGERSVAAFYARIAPEPQYGGVTRAFVNVLNAPVVRRRVVR